MPAIIVDPELLAAVVREFNLRGELQPFNLTENVVPVFDIGRLTGARAPTVVTTLENSQGVRVGLLARAEGLATLTAEVDDGDITDSGVVTNPTAGDVIVDSGQLGNGNFTVEASVSADPVTPFTLEWRNAANSANLASMTVITDSHGFKFGPWNLRMAIDERIRIVSVNSLTGDVTAFVMAGLTAASLAS